MGSEFTDPIIPAYLFKPLLIRNPIKLTNHLNHKQTNCLTHLTYLKNYKLALDNLRITIYIIIVRIKIRF